jgi:hypothetical protein
VNDDVVTRREDAEVGAEVLDMRAEARRRLAHRWWTEARDSQRRLLDHEPATD